jgi:hypothetical protein
MLITTLEEWLHGRSFIWWLLLSLLFIVAVGANAWAVTKRIKWRRSFRGCFLPLSPVGRGTEAATAAVLPIELSFRMDCRVEPGNDEERNGK